MTRKGQATLTTYLTAAAVVALVVAAGVYYTSLSSNSTASSSGSAARSSGSTATTPASGSSATGTAAGSAAGATAVPCKGGDFSEDGRLSEVDLDALSLVLDDLATTGVPYYNLKCADVNGDGFMTADDEICLSGLLSGLYSSVADCPDCDKTSDYEICHDGLDNDCDGQADKETYDNAAGTAYSSDVCVCSSETPSSILYDADGVPGFSGPSDKEWCRDHSGAYSWGLAGFVTASGGDFYYNGQVWKPYGINYFSDLRWLTSSYDSAGVEEDLANIKNSGFNAVGTITGDYATKAATDDFFRLLDKYGLKTDLFFYICDPLYYADNMSICTDTITRLNLKDSDELFGYIIGPEPGFGQQAARDASQMRYEFGKWAAKNYGSFEKALVAWGFTPKYYCGAAVDAACTNHNIPSVMVAGQSYTVSMTVVNLGSETWGTDSTYTLGSVTPYALDASSWYDKALVHTGPDPFAVEGWFFPPSVSVPTGGSHTFTLTMKAPETPGRYKSDWSMVYGGVNAFGRMCAQTVTVIPTGTALQEQVVYAPVPCGPTDTELCADSTANRFVSAYRRFVGDYTSDRYNKGVRAIKEADPNHLIGTDRDLASQIGCPYMALNGRDAAKHLDFMPAEFYARARSTSEVYNPDVFRKMGFQTRYMDVGKPVLYSEFGEDAMVVGEQRQADYYTYFYTMAIESGADGAIAWVYKNDIMDTTPATSSDYSVFGKQAFNVMVQCASLFLNRAVRTANWWITVDIDSHAGEWQVFDEAMNLYLYGLTQGMTADVITPCTGTDSATVSLICVGNYQVPDCPQKCLNSEFNYIKIKDYNGDWVEVKDGETVVVKSGQPVYAKASLGNIGEAKWLTTVSAASENGYVFLGDQTGGGSFFLPITSDVPWMSDADFGEFKVTDGLSGDRSVTFQLASANRVWFGDKAVITLHPV